MAPTVKAVAIRGNVSDEDGAAIHDLKFLELALEPLNFVARIVTVLQELPVLVVACLSVDAEDPCLVEDPPILELKCSGIVTVLSEILKGLSVQPVSPGTGEAIDGLVCVRCGEILNIHWPCVMIALNWVHRNVCAIESSLNSESNILGSIADLSNIICPNVMRGVVAGPEEQVRFHLGFHKFQHVVQA
jgi:hypothetical protein